MRPTEKQVWESVRARGHTDYILRSLIRHGIPFGALMTFGPPLYHAAVHTPYTPHTFPWPLVNIVFDFLFRSAVFGYLMGEWVWRKHERDYGQSQD